ncbi:unnamed protein product [Camellia sinensis]
MKAYRTYWLTSGCDALNCSVVYVSQDNRLHIVYPQTQFGSYGCVHCDPEQRLEQADSFSSREVAESRSCRIHGTHQPYFIVKGSSARGHSQTMLALPVCDNYNIVSSLCRHKFVPPQTTRVIKHGEWGQSFQYQCGESLFFPESTASCGKHCASYVRCNSFFMLTYL